MTIQTKILPEHKLTIHTGQNTLIFDELMATLRDFYRHEPTVNVLWDVRETSLTHLTADQLRIIAHYAAQQASHRPQGKTAFLISHRLGDYGMARMLEILADVERIELSTQIFSDYDEAIHWLTGESAIDL